MKKADLEKRIAQMAKDANVTWKSAGGSKHDKFLLNGATIMIPRHREIGEMLAKAILRQAEDAIDN